MEKEEIIKYWIDTSDRDYQTLEHLFQMGDYHWGLFLGHLTLEKLIKALFVKRTGDYPPRIHDLVRLAEKSGIKVSEEMLVNLELITRFNLSIRYPDYQQEIYRICNKEYSYNVLKSIDEARAWLKKLIQES